MPCTITGVNLKCDAFAVIPTMQTFNSCTKCVGSPGIIHDRTPDCHPISWAYISLQLNVALIRKLPQQTQNICAMSTKYLTQYL